MSDSFALEFNDVTKRFGETSVVRGVSLAVRRGEFLTLLGPSGCGKTTMLRLMAGFETATSGDIRIDGVDVTATPAYRRRIGMVFQSLALFPHMSVGGNIAFGLTVERLGAAERRARVANVLQLVGLTGFEERSTASLSGGQRQRVALARSLVTEPRVLLLDEPFSALDLTLRRQMQLELKEIQRRTGATFVFVTHDQEEALSMSDRIAVVHDGRIAQIDVPREIYLRPATTRVGIALGEANLFPAVRKGDSYAIETLGMSFPAGDVSGAVAIIVVRPEQIAIARTLAAPVKAAAVVLDASFVGSSISYTIRGGDAVVKIRVPYEARSLPLNVGDAVEFGWSAGDCSIVNQ